MYTYQLLTPNLKITPNLMKKYIVLVLVTSIFTTGSFLPVSRVMASDMSVRDFVNLLITIGVISPDKIPAVNAYLATIDNSRPTLNRIEIYSVVDIMPNQPINSVRQGFSATINGKNFSPYSANHIFIGTKEMSNISGNATSIDFTIPVNISPGINSLYVLNDAGASNAIQINVISTPMSSSPIVITSVIDKSTSLPTNQIKNGDHITILGNNFPASGSFYITKEVTDTMEGGHGFFREVGPGPVWQHMINTPFVERDPGTYFLRIVGVDGRTSDFTKIKIVP